MNDKIKEILKGSVRGSRQYEIANDLILDNETSELHIYIKAQTSYSNYLTSFRNYIERANAELKPLGYELKRIGGKLGGDWTAKYKLSEVK